MATLNKVMFIGNLTHDPELRFVTSGDPVCNFTVAINYKKDKNKTVFVRVVAWNKLAELCNERLAKSKQVFIEGRLSMFTFEDSEGKKRSNLYIVANNVQFLSPREDRASE